MSDNAQPSDTARRAAGKTARERAGMLMCRCGIVGLNVVNANLQGAIEDVFLLLDSTAAERDAQASRVRELEAALDKAERDAMANHNRAVRLQAELAALARKEKL